MTVNIAILKADGTNCDELTHYAFRLAGGKPQIVHVKDLIRKKMSLKKFQILTIPGGFSYGDDILSGKVLANELNNLLREEFEDFIQQNKLILGICNGFQVLIRMGLLPGDHQPAEKASLIFNDSGHFECRWIKLRVEKSISVFTRNLAGRVIELPINSGEGKFITKNQTVLNNLIKNQQIVFRYAHPDGSLATDYPANPNGSIGAIAGICNRQGTIMGLMPHPERYISYHQHPNWTRQRPWDRKPDGLEIFKNAVEYAAKHL